jgi:hypothetical protein
MRFGETLDQITSILNQIKTENAKRYNSFDENGNGQDAKPSGWSKSQQDNDPIRTQVINALSRHDAIYNEIVQRLFKPKNRLEGPYPAVLPDDEPYFQDAIINSLVDGVFHEIKDREEAIPQPYTDTYSWVFERTPAERGGISLWSSFPTWLEAKTESPFWITGKPGSGKSTLMKYILHDKRLGPHLRVWAGNFPLKITSFFAWIAGSDLQNSTRGLIRTVLYQCLQSSKELTAVVAPRRWALCSTLSNCNRLPPWEDWELHESFNLLLLHIVKYKRVAIFIDGLDEFKIMPTEILAVILELCRRDGFKVCVASRQWVEFNDKLDGYPMLRMQDLTRDDTLLFVQGSLRDNRGFNELRQIFRAEVDSLVLEVVNKCNGVFLWAHLVIRNLLQAFSEGDGLPKLRETLQSLPGDLDKLYLTIWEQSGDRQSEFAQFVALKRAAEGSLYFLNFWLTDQANSQEVDMSNLTTALLNAIRSQVVRRLDKCTRGILELSRSDNVDYLHRTTLDWLARDDIWAKIRLYLSPDFDANLSLLHSEALMCRRPWDRMDLSDQRVYEVLRYAHRIENHPTNKRRLTRILDNFNEEMTERHKSVASIPGNINGWTSRYNCSFLDLACRYCATPYLDTKIRHNKQNTELQRRSSEAEPQARPEIGQAFGPICDDSASALENVVLGHAYTSLSAIVPLQVRQETAQILLHKGSTTNQALKANILQLAAEKSIAEAVEDEWTEKNRAEREYLTEMIRLLNVEDGQAPEAPTSSGKSTPSEAPTRPAPSELGAMPPTGRQSKAARLLAFIKRG